MAAGACECVDAFTGDDSGSSGLPGLFVVGFPRAGDWRLLRDGYIAGVAAPPRIAEPADVSDRRHAVRRDCQIGVAGWLAARPKQGVRNGDMLDRDARASSRKRSMKALVHNLRSGGSGGAPGGF